MLSQLGEGGFGIVYEAEDLVNGVRVAIKILKIDEDSEATLAQQLGRFRREGKIIATLDSPHLVDLLAMGHHEGAPYAVFSFAPGKDLSDMRAETEGGMDLTLVREIMIQILKTLQYAHKSGVIHRDVKPANIKVDTENGVFVRVMDFGIARLRRRKKFKNALTLTRSGQVLGTELYMSPEQKYAPGEVDHRSDLYSWALIYVELVHTRADAEAFLMMHLTGGRPKYPERLSSVEERLLLRCLHPRAENRPETAEVLAALAFLTGKASKAALHWYEFKARVKGRWAAIRKSPVKILISIWVVIIAIVLVALSI